MADDALAVQAQAEGLRLTVEKVDGKPEVVADRITFAGQQFRIRNRVPMLALMKFADAAQSGLGNGDPDGLAAMYALIKGCIDADEWHRFERAALDSGADADELFQVVQDTVELVTARPTQPPSVSSSGRPATSVSSRASSPLREREGARLAGLRPVGDLIADPSSA